MIGLIGGSGNVGSHVLEFLARALPREEIRAGARNPDRIMIPAGCENVCRQSVDVYEDESLEAFVRGCSIMVTCAAPSRLITPLLAGKAVKYGFALVDAGLCEEGLETEAAQDVCIVHGAGSVPGISGMLPLFAAGRLARPETLLFFYEIKDVFTPAAARDYLAGAMKGGTGPTQIYKNRDSFFNRAGGYRKIDLWGFDRAVRIFPYTDAETDWVTQKLALANSEWYSAFSGEHLLQCMGGLFAKYKRDPEEAVKLLCEASARDVSEDRSYVRYVLRMTGRDQDGRKKEVRLIACAKSQPYLTAAAAAAQVLTLYEGGRRSGICPLCQSGHVEEYFENLSRLNAFEEITVCDSSREKITGKI